jgi:hypothetical protein
MRFLLSFLASLILFVGTANAVVTISEPTAEVSSTSNATSYSLAAFTPAADSILVVFVGASDTVAVATMTGGGLTWTLETSQLYSSANTMYMFWAKTGSSPGSTTITFDCTGDTASGANMVVFEVAGGDVVTSNPIKQRKSNATTSTDPTVTMDAAFTVTNGGVYAIGVNRSSPAYTPPTLWNETADTGHGSPNNGIESAYKIGETGSTITATGSSGAWGMIVAEVYESGAGPSGTGVPSIFQGDM